MKRYFLTALAPSRGVLDQTEEQAQSYSDAVRAVLAGQQAANLRLEPAS
jgi:hypothetical protein